MSAATTSVADGWSRNRLLVILGCAGVAALALLMGFGYAVYLAIHSAVTETTVGQQATLGRRQMNSDTALGDRHRDQIAAQPMLQVTADAMKPTTPTTQLADSMLIPAATRTGPADVPSGFPHTPEGAVGQLGAIGQTVIGAMSVATAHRVYAAWAMPGGVGADQWQMTTNVTSFLGAAGMGPTRTPGATTTAIPSGALVKGTDGPDWTVACVLFEVDATISSPSSIGYGYCERMLWNTEPGAPAGGRWEIAPGSPPTPAPNTWPGSALALEVGWLTWTSTPTRCAGTGPPPTPPTTPQVTQRAPPPPPPSRSASRVLAAFLSRRGYGYPCPQPLRPSPQPLLGPGRRGR